jgi:O-acetyl-ADP-ribose deacetylase (regulator of RNase III)
MIEYKKGDMLREDVEALVNTVNCVGIMGRGIALQFRETFPDNYRKYAVACKREEVRPGKMFIVETGWLTNPKFIINFPTKRHWRGKSRIEDIESGLEALHGEIERLHIHSIAVPPLGSGLGGLHWPDVRARIEQVLGDLRSVRVVVFEPNGDEGSRIKSPNRDVPKMSPGRAALVGLVQRYLSGLMDPFVSLLEVHKLMYFMQEAGEKLRLRYEKGPYGPYAENLRYVLRDIEGHMLSGYRDVGDSPTEQLALVPGAVEDAEAFLSHSQETNAHFKRVADLVQGFETPFGLELLATVHWLLAHENVRGSDELVTRTHAWNDRKRQFTPRQIGLAEQVLREKGWVVGA